jgi:hypothetical protein
VAGEGGERGAARLEHSLAAASEWRKPTDFLYCELNKDTENRCLITEPNQNRKNVLLFIFFTFPVQYLVQSVTGVYIRHEFKFVYKLSPNN